jgi:regulator of PEP synthase PpsR (kinase-PPPase family)
MGSKEKKVNVFIVSDATGITAERVISAALVQFQEIKPVFKRFPNIQALKQIDNLLAEAEKLDAIVIYSLVAEDMREHFRRERRKKNVYAIDLLGPLIRRIGGMWNVIPTARPGMYKGIDQESIRLAESIDFTLKHDDGQNLETINDADIIILGISRTSKTPTSLYLSCNYNLKVANFPIIPGEEPPEGILKGRARKVGLTISPAKVAIIRKSRLRYTGSNDYSDIECIKRELLYSHKIFRQVHGLQLIDVTNSSIEEISDKIVARS